MRGLGQTAKALAIAGGIYRPVRWLARRFSARQRRRLADEVALYRALVPQGALCFDVGANIGEKSEAMLLAGARVVAFEPHPLVLGELGARCAPWPGWQVVRAAVGSRSAIATLHTRAAHGQSSLVEDWEGQATGRVDVPVVTLDAAIERFGLPHYCKIDVEGWELEVLRGLSHPLPLVSFEFHLGGRGVTDTRACLAVLDRQGPGEVNVTPAERAAFHWPRWMPLAEFLAWYPGDLPTTLPGNPYGDIYVRRSIR